MICDVTLVVRSFSLIIMHLIILPVALRLRNERCTFTADTSSGQHCAQAMVARERVHASPLTQNEVLLSNLFR